MKPVPTSENKDLKSGLYQEGAVSRNQMPLDAVSDVVNMHFDEIGAAKVRPGLTQVGDSKTGNVLGLYNFRDAGAGSNNQIVMVNDTVLYYLSGGTWTSRRTGLTAGSKAEFTTYLDYLFMVNGADTTASWDGNPSNAFSTSTNVTNAPIGKYIENFRSRLWIAGNSTYPDRVYYSSLPSSVTTPVITWDTDVGTGQWIDISPSDGENITWLKRYKKALLVFKNNHIYRVYSISTSDPDPQTNVGTYSGRSVVETKNGIYFHHPSGFYRYVDGEVAEISKPIQDIVDNITLANYSTVTGWQDGDHVYWAVGDVTWGGIARSNVVVRYTISSKAWTYYAYPTQFLVASQYNDGSSIFHLVGDESGEVYKVNVGNTDAGTPIQYALTHRWMTLDGLVNTEKTVQQVSFEHDKGIGTKVSYQTQDSQPTEYQPLGQFSENDTLLPAGFRARRFRLRISGESSGEPFTYRGYEIMDITAEPVNH